MAILEQKTLINIPPIHSKACWLSFMKLIMQRQTLRSFAAINFYPLLLNVVVLGEEKKNCLSIILAIFRNYKTTTLIKAIY